MLITIIPCLIYAQPTSQYSGLRRSIGSHNVTVVDSAKLRVTYSLKFIADSSKLQQILKDRKILLIGERMNHFYSYYVRQSDSALTADLAKGKNSFPLKRAPDILGEGYEVYSNPLSKRRTVLEPITVLSDYKYEEALEVPQWVITNDTCTILSYLCRKATARLYGRNWEVWFSSAIPLNAGPWKLRGLPGLILKAYDSKRHYVFECIGMEQLKKKEPIIMRKTYYIACSRKEYQQAQKQFYSNYINSLSAMGFNIIIVDDSGTILEHLLTPNKSFEEQGLGMYGMRINVKDRYKKMPYNPIELE